MRRKEKSSTPYFKLKVLKENDRQMNQLSSSFTKYKCYISSRLDNMPWEDTIANRCFTFYCHIALLTLIIPMEASHYLYVKQLITEVEKNAGTMPWTFNIQTSFNGYDFSVFNSVIKVQTSKLKIWLKTQTSDGLMTCSVLMIKNNI